MMSPWMHSLATLVIIVPAFLTAIAFHEYAHALAATLLGDHTPRSLGRLTLNPLAHIDPLGFLLILVFGIGWAQPVIFDHRNFKWPRLFRILTALAGPCANFILAIIALYGLKYGHNVFSSPASLKTLEQILSGILWANLSLGTFNLLPVPPLDGSHIIMTFLEESYPDVAEIVYQYSIFILLFFLIIPQTRDILNGLFILTYHLLTKLVI